jgi:hypothetical protein
VIDRLRVSSITSFHSVTTIIHNSSIMYTANDIKSFQYFLITKAGLAVSEKKEMSLKIFEKDVFSEFEAAVTNCIVPENLKGMNTALLLRSKNILSRTCGLDDNHTGESIWREFAEIKRVICNDFTDLYNAQMPHPDAIYHQCYSLILIQFTIINGCNKPIKLHDGFIIPCTRMAYCRCKYFFVWSTVTS